MLFPYFFIGPASTNMHRVPLVQQYKMSFIYVHRFASHCLCIEDLAAAQGYLVIRMEGKVLTFGAPIMAHKYWGPWLQPN